MPGEEEGQPEAKRGRPRGNTRNAGEDGGETRQEAPKKRGRPRAAGKEVREAAEGSPDAEQPAGMRKRPRASRDEAEDGGEDELEGGSAPKRRRGRRSLDEAPADETQDGAPGPAARKKRGKRNATQDVGAPVEAEEPKRRGRPRTSGDSDAASTDRKRTRGRPRRSDVSEPDAEPAEPRKRGRPRRSDVSEAADAPEPKKRGRPRLSDASDAAAEPSEPKKRGRPRRSDMSDTAAEPSEPKKRGRPRHSDVSDGGPQSRPQTTRGASRSPSPASPSQPQKKPYAYLAPKQRDIPVSTISATWTPLQAPSLALARQTLHFSTRPVLQSLAPGPRRDAASSALRAATRRLTSKLSKGLPFPPASRAAAKAAGRAKVPRADGREAELDFESVAAEMEALEGRLQPLLHSIEVLRGEERRMEGVLEMEAGELEVLSRNGREERKVWREGLRKKGHPLVPDRWDPDGDSGDRLALAPREAPPSEWLFTVCSLPVSKSRKDAANARQNAKGALPLSTLASHVASLRNNVRPVQGLDRAMADSEAAIRRVLERALGAEGYEAAIMAERT